MSEETEIRDVKKYLIKQPLTFRAYVTKSGYRSARINELIDKHFYRSKFDGMLYAKKGKKPKSYWTIPSEYEDLYF